LSDQVEIDDLCLLDGHDLRAVLSQVPEAQLLEALGGMTAALRTQLLKKLPRATANSLTAELEARGPIPAGSARLAQRALVEALCRLSRAGLVAFDDPGDMVA
jgi:flagellar motor switch protein FliG